MARQWRRRPLHDALLGCWLLLVGSLVASRPLGPKLSPHALCPASSPPGTASTANTFRVGPFIKSGLAEASYRNICGVDFVRLLRIYHHPSQVGAIALVMQFVTLSGQFVNLTKTKVLDLDTSNSVFVVQIQSHFSDFFQVQLNGQIQEVSLVAGQTAKLVITKQFELNSYAELRIDHRLEKSVSYTVTCSSLDVSFVCVATSLDPVKCACHRTQWRQRLARDTNLSNKVQDEPVEQPHLGVILPLLLIFLILVAVSGVIIYDKLVDRPEKKEPEEQYNLILCMPENAQFEYNLIFRVGCPSGDFNLKESYIDFEIIGPQNEIIGTPVRFSCNLLPDNICGEMHCLIGRITPMPSIVGIRANHSDENGNYIFFYEFELIDLKDDTVVERREILEYIDNKPILFKGQSESAEDSDGVGLYPELPIMELTRVETATIVSFIFLYTGALVMLFEYFNLYFLCKNEAGSLYRSLQDIVFITPCVLLSLFIVIYIYKYNIKRITLRHEYSPKESNPGFWRHVNTSFLIFLVKLCVVCGALMIYFGLQLNFLMSIYWYSSCLVITVLVLETWAMASKLVIFRRCYEGDHTRPLSHSVRLDATYRKKYMSDYRNYEDKTVYFTKAPSSTDRSPVPKMINPYLNQSASCRSKMIKKLKKTHPKSKKVASEKSKKSQRAKSKKQSSRKSGKV